MDTLTIGLIAILAVVVIIGGGYITMVRRSGASALHLAAGDEQTTKAASLLTDGADPNKQDKWGRTPLYQAILTGSPNMVDLLLDFGADPNIADHNGEASLHHASSRRLPHGAEGIVLSLYKHGANPETLNRNGETPHRRAIRLVRLDIADAIERPLPTSHPDA